MIVDILQILPGRKKSTPSGWHTFNAVCCHHRGHKMDSRMRGGVKFEGSQQWIYHCFNCGFSCGVETGKPLSPKVSILLEWCHLSKEEITQLTINSLKSVSSIEQFLNNRKQEWKEPEWNEIIIPDEFEPISGLEPDNVYENYLNNRGFSSSKFPFLFSTDGKQRQQIVFPFTYKNRIVGYSSRFLDNKEPRYIHHHPQNYLFGLDFQHQFWQQIFVVEGAFDALSIDGVATLHDSISAYQIRLLQSLQKPVIWVPDQDKTGLNMNTLQTILDSGFKVSIPDWNEYTDKKIKDANDAVCELGKFLTTVAICENATTNIARIQYMRKKLNV